MLQAVRLRFIAASARPSVAVPRRRLHRLDFHPEVAALAKLPVVDSTSLRTMVVHLAGKSGKLLARFVLPPRSISGFRSSRTISATHRSSFPTVQEITGASKSAGSR